MNDENQENNNGANKAVALIFSALTFIGVGFIIVCIQLLFIPEMNFSENGIIRFIGLILCYITASKVYNHLTK